MPKIAAEMTALQVARLSGDGDYQVGGVPGLLMRIKGGSKVWVLRARVDGERRNIGLGPYPQVSMAQARDDARRKRESIRQGQTEDLTVKEVRRKTATAKAAAVLFRDAAKAMILSMKAGWKNEKHGDQWTNTLETYAFPKLGGLAVPDITTDLVLQVLEPIWYEKPETASRVRGRIESVIDYVAARHNLQIQNPARWKGHLDKLLPKKAKVKKVVHHKAVPWKDAAEVCAKIMARRGVAAQALQAVILTAARHSEVTGMRKSELLLEERIWIIPSERMKIPRDHFVPISDQFLALLLSVGAGEGNPDDLVFGSSQKQRKGQELSENTLTKVMQNNDIDATTHGWRSTFRDWAAETTHYPNELCEIALAHTIPNKAEAAYRRGDMLEKRRPLMQDWANYVMPK